MNNYRPYVKITGWESHQIDFIYMKVLLFKNKIAFNFTLSTALLVVVIFFVIYHIVSLTVFNGLEKDVTFQADKHFYEVGVKVGLPYILPTKRNGLKENIVSGKSISCS